MKITARNVHEGQGRNAGRESNLQDPGLEGNLICDACLQLSTEAESVLKNPDTEKTLVELFSQMACENLMSPKMKSKVRLFCPSGIVMRWSSGRVIFSWL
ncbi:hypothetical protein R1flu_006460 [Riccia fluitans]|uniref:Uncharacterized protein n=1 Tax=Riccia fluitans TaxID=41844 RepID=A0ABD1YW33_9MARC